MILSLDTATVCGWACGVPGEEPLYGARDFGDGRSNGEIGGRFRAWLNALCYEFKPKLIVFEAPYIPRVGGGGVPLNAHVLRRLLALTGNVETTAWELQIECREATTLEVARFFIGSQRLKRGEKKQRTIEMCERYGWAPECDNAADALALWAMAEARLAPRVAARRGAGPLFIPPQKTIAPGTSRGDRIRRPPDEGKSSCMLVQTLI